MKSWKFSVKKHEVSLIIVGKTGVIKSYSLTSRTSDFWGGQVKIYLSVAHGQLDFATPPVLNYYH